MKRSQSPYFRALMVSLKKVGLKQKHERIFLESQKKENSKFRKQNWGLKLDCKFQFSFSYYKLSYKMLLNIKSKKKFFFA